MTVESQPVPVSGSPFPGYILAGGKSSRFGSDKARAVLEGRPLIVRLAEALKERCGTVTVVADAARKYADLGLETIADIQSGRGPLAGIEAALDDRLNRRGEGWVTLVSCDLLVLRQPWITMLRDGVREGASAVVFRADFWQPFPGLYHTDALDAVRRLLDAGRGSFQRLLAETPAVACPLPPDWPVVLQANTPEELENAAKTLESPERM